MALGSGGSFAGGFINAFLQARRLRMEQDHYKVIDNYYRQIMARAGMGSPADRAYAAGQREYNARGGGGNDNTGTSASGIGNPEVEAYVRKAAADRGIDPDTAVKVFGHEGLREFDPSNPKSAVGDGGSSFGPLQLHYGNINPDMPHAGLGDDFTKATGLQASDPSTWKAQVDFGMDHVASQGWGAWAGSKAENVGPWDGITRGTGGPVPTRMVGAPGKTAPGEPVKLAGATPDPQAGAPGKTAPVVVAAGDPGETAVVNKTQPNPDGTFTYANGVHTDGQGRLLSGEGAPNQGAIPSAPMPPTKPADIAAQQKDASSLDAASATPAGAMPVGAMPAGAIPSAASGDNVTAQSQTPSAPPQAAAPPPPVQGGATNDQGQLNGIFTTGPDGSAQWNPMAYADGGLVQPPFYDPASPSAVGYGPAAYGQEGYDPGAGAPGSQYDWSQAGVIPSAPQQSVQEDTNPADMPVPDAQDAEYAGPGSTSGENGLRLMQRGAMRAGMSGGYGSVSAGRSMGMGRSSVPRGALPNQGPTPQGFGLDPSNGDPDITSGDGDISDTITGAIKGGMRMLSNALGGNTAVPGDATAGANRQKFLDGEDSMTKAEHATLIKGIDPKGQLNDTMANLAGLASMRSYYLAIGDENAADHTAASMLMYSRDQAAQLAGHGYNELCRGNTEGGVKALCQAYDHVPDGRTAEPTAINPDGSATIVQKNMNGEVVNQMDVTPQQIMSAALGLKNGTLYWNLLNDATQPKGAAAPSAQYQALVGGLDGPQAGGAPQQGAPQQGAPQVSPIPPAQGAVPSQAAPATPQPGVVTPQSNTPALPASLTTGGPQAAPQQGAIPSSPALEQQSGINDVYSHLPVMPSYLNPPRAQIAALPPHEQAAAVNAIRSAQKNWYDQTYKPALDEAHRLIAADQAKRNQMDINDRQDQHANETMTQQQRLEDQREQAKQNAPYDPTRQGALDQETSDALAKAPALFNPKDPSQFAKRFNPEDQDTLASAAMSISAFSHVPTAIGMRAVASVVSPTDKNLVPGGKDTPEFQAAYDRNTKMVSLTFGNGQVVRMPGGTFSGLIAIRAAQRAQAMKAASGDGVNQQTKAALQKSIGDRLAAPPTNAAGQTAGAPIPISKLFTGKASMPGLWQAPEGAIPSPVTPRGPLRNPGLSQLEQDQ